MTFIKPKKNVESMKIKLDLRYSLNYAAGIAEVAC